VIETGAPVALEDQPAHLEITGLAPRDTVTVTSQAVDNRGKPWQSQAVFRADAHGDLALDTTAPLSGSYRGVDGMGLFWSMNTPSLAPDQASFPTNTSFSVRISVSAHGRTLATRSLTREWIGPGVTTTVLTLAKDKVVGDLYLPRAGTPRHPAVLVFGGSEGGNSQKAVASLLASHGYPALSLAYFDEPGLPSTLTDIPLEYFVTAAKLLAAQPAVDPAHVIAMGSSRGSEAALLLGEDYPDLIHGVVVNAPSAEVNTGDGGAAWTQGGDPVPQLPIALNHISGPVLAITGADDQLWPSPDWSQQIMNTLSTDGDRYPHQALIYPNAGHWAGGVPFYPEGTEDPGGNDLGGTRAGDAAAQEAGWPRVLALLASLA
jgi:dienelactone hydrolase